MNLCPVCHQPMRVFAPDADRPHHVNADCPTPECPLFRVTLAMGDHDTLTPAQIESWGRTNQRQREMKARREAVRA